MIRRRMTVKRLDPWSVLKFSAVANVVLYAILLLVAGVIWFIVDRLHLVDQACGIATDVGFTTCGVNAGNLFRALVLLGGMGVIVQTAVFVFCAFLYNLISDLTGGLTIGVVDETPMVRGTGSRRNGGIRPRQADGTTGGSVARPRPQAARSRQPAGRPRAEGEELFEQG